ncbi:MAG: 23S rRNA (guanosine(2251)-2'-O)-methyltransferase RlmB [Acidimicrobiia bacterium]
MSGGAGRPAGNKANGGKQPRKSNQSSRPKLRGADAARASAARKNAKNPGQPMSSAAKKAVEGRKAKAQASSAAGRARSVAGRPSGRGRPDARGAAAAGPRIPNGPKGLGGDQVEGRQAVRELLLAGNRKVREIWVATDLDDADIVSDIFDLAEEMRVPVRDVSRAKLDAEARTDAPQGILAKAVSLEETDFEDLLRVVPGKPKPFLVALDGVTDPGNLGAVLRTAECAGVTGIVLPRHRAVHVTPTVTKTAAGAIEYLPMALVGGLPTALARAKQLGVWVIGLDGVADRTLFEIPELGTEPVILVLGAEGAGLSRLVRQRCDEVVSIPMRGRLASLNVAAAGALAVYEVARRRAN